MKKKPVKEQSIDLTMKARDEEIKNHEKMTKNLFYEYEKLQYRLEQVSDPLFLSELKRKNVELDGRLKTLGREQKNLQNDQFRREKRLDKIIMQGEPESQQAINIATKELN